MAASSGDSYQRLRRNPGQEEHSPSDVGEANPPWKSTRSRPDARPSGPASSLPALERRAARRAAQSRRLVEASAKGDAQGGDADSPNGAVHAFRTKQPLWLTLLSWLQQGSVVVTLMLVVSVLITYGWTVYGQQQWGKSFDRLEALKKQERQLVSANEVLKNQMAQQAEKPTAGLLLPDPSNAIFLTPAPQRPPVKSKPLAPVTDSDPITPLGY